MNNSQYFYRTVVFTRKNNEIALADINKPENTTPLDEWLGTVLSLADGEHTLEELIVYMASRYTVVPDNLEKTLHSVVERLLDGNLIKLSDTQVSLPYYLSAPIEELNLKTAKKQIKDDGYTVN